MADGAGRVARNVVLADLLGRVQWSPQDLAERLNALAAMLDLGTQLHFEDAAALVQRPGRRWHSGTFSPRCGPRRPARITQRARTSWGSSAS